MLCKLFTSSLVTVSRAQRPETVQRRAATQQFRDVFGLCRQQLAGTCSVNTATFAV